MQVPPGRKSAQGDPRAFPRVEGLARALPDRYDSVSNPFVDLDEPVVRSMIDRRPPGNAPKEGSCSNFREVLLRLTVLVGTNGAHLT